MARPTAEEILAEATRLKSERYNSRIEQIRRRADERFNLTPVTVPAAYEKTSHDHKFNIIDDEGRQVATLVHNMPTPHIAPPTPEDQPATTRCEKFLIAMMEELERKNGPVWWQCTMSQVHNNEGEIFFFPKKVPYAGQPTDTEEDDFDERNDRYKREQGIASIFDYEYATTGTVMRVGNIYHPHCVYVWKEVRADELRKTYGVYMDREGKIRPIVAGDLPDSGGTDTKITVVEYWDDEYCVIVVQEKSSRWFGLREVRGSYEVAEWRHGKGRTPYFIRPAFVTEQLDEDKRFAGPLDGIHNEMPSHKRLRKMADSVSYQTAFAPLKIVTKETGDLILDENAKPLTFIELEPGKARQLAPGQDIAPVGQSPEVANLYQELAASLQRIQSYQLTPVTKGISPGADTANAALSNLHRFQLSTLDPMSEQIGLQHAAICKLALECIRELGETVYVLDKEANAYLSLSAADIVSTNVQSKSTPDQGQFQLLIEKHAMELWLNGAITEVEMHEMRGKENPEEYVLANAAERLERQLEPILMQQMVADFGMLDAMNAMAQANAEGQPSRAAVPGLMEQARAINGIGKGSPGQPRNPGVRMPTEDVNTQRGQAVGY